MNAAPDPRLFAALGHPSRMVVLTGLRATPGLTTTALAELTDSSRQAVTKHLLVLEEAGLVQGERRGRERHWRVEPRPLAEAAAWLDAFRELWEQRFDRLDAFLDQTRPEDER